MCFDFFGNFYKKGNKLVFYLTYTHTIVRVIRKRLSWNILQIPVHHHRDTPEAVDDVGVHDTAHCRPAVVHHGIGPDPQFFFPFFFIQI